MKLPQGPALAVLIAVAPACGRHHAPGRPPELEARQGEIALRVTNHNYLDVTVYVLRDGQRTRVGTVTGSSTQVFFLPVGLLGQGREIQLLGDPIGSTDVARTDTFVVQPGQYVEWTLESDLRRSSVAVY